MKTLTIKRKFIVLLSTVISIVTAIVTIINVVQFNHRDAYFLEKLQNNAVITYDDSTGLPVINFNDVYNLEGTFWPIFFSILPMVIIMLLSAFLIVMVIHFTLIPLTKLTKAAHEVANGNFDVRFTVNKNDEISQLSASFLMVVNSLNILQENFKKAENAMKRGDILYRLKDIELGGKFNDILTNANNIIEEFQMFFELLSEPIVIIDSDLRVRYANKIMRVNTGSNTKDYLGNRINSFVNGEIAAYFGNSLSTGKPVLEEEIRLQLSPGKFFDFELNFVPFSVDGRVEGAVLILLDVTKIKQLQRAQIEAESAARAKNDFLSKMSHELRTPMNSILGVTDMQLLSSNHLPETEEAFLQIKSYSNMLITIINDIFDLSKLEADELKLLKEPYDLATLIFEIMQSNLVYMGTKNIEFNLEIADEMPACLLGDSVRIKQVVGNLVSNALKYTREGEVKLRVSFEREHEKSILVLEVIDTGPGMTCEQISLIFGGDYTCFDNITSRLVEGTGLGVNITNRLVQMMNGTLTVESNIGKGTICTVKLHQIAVGDYKITNKIKDKLLSFEALHKKSRKQYGFTYEHMPYGTVLIVDDMDSNLEVAKGLITPYGVKVETASSGQEVISLVKAGKKYDIIFMDYMMPGLDGLDTGKEIFKLGYDKPIIILTANKIVEQEKFINAGFSGFMTKPVDVNLLNDFVQRFIRGTYKNEAEPYKNQAKIPSKAVRNSFLRDSTRVYESLVALMTKEIWDKNDYKNFTIYTHGMKSALININQLSLSNIAKELEQAGGSKNSILIWRKTPEFLESLKQVIDSLSPDEDSNISIVEENNEILKEQLEKIKDACEAYNKKNVRNALIELGKYSWNKETNDLIEDITIKLLHSEFEEIVQLLIIPN